MRGLIDKRFSSSVILLLGLVLTGSVSSETLHKETDQAEAKPIVIMSKSLELDNARKVLTFSGDVNAKRDDFVIDCQEMLVYYEGSPIQQEAKEVNPKFNRIVATGKVEIKRAQGGVATAEKASYFQEDDKIILTGSPVVKEGDDFVKGDRITIFLKENRIVIESSADNRVRATIFPKSEQQ